MSEQTQELSRVSGNIGPAIERFFAIRLDVALPTFVMRELYDYVASDHQVAPASVDRILRSLRTAKRVDYSVVNRRQSLYRINVVKRQQSLFATGGR